MKFLLTVCLMLSATIIFAATGITVGNESVVTQILTGLVGVVIYYASKLGNAGLNGFDFAFWWKENKISLFANIGAIIIVTLLGMFNIDILKSILGFMGANIDGQIGSIAFSSVLAGVVHNLVKQMRGKAYTRTDGKGNAK